MSALLDKGGQPVKAAPATRQGAKTSMGGLAEVGNVLEDGLVASLWRASGAEKLKTRIIGRRVKQADECSVSKKNLYIAPTGAGAMLGVTLLAMLVASINYESNLGHAVTFMLVGVSAASMFATFFNIHRLKMSLGTAHSVFEGGACNVSVVVSNPKKSDSHELELAWRTEDANKVFMPPVNVPGGQSQVVHLALTATKRGRMALPMVCMRSKYPIGVYAAWSYLHPKSQVLVYPKPERNPPPLAQITSRDDGQEGCSSAQVSDEYDGVRPYRRGDSMKSIVWRLAAKSFARGSDELVVRDQLMGTQSSLWFDIRYTGHAHSQSDELKLSRLCAWVLAADAQGMTYGLRLGAVEVEPGSGPGHLERCLKAMAEH